MAKSPEDSSQRGSYREKSHQEHPIVSTPQNKILRSPLAGGSTTVNFKEVFLASPIIYSILLLMSVGAFSIWLYTLITFRPKEVLSEDILHNLRFHLSQKNYPEALSFCKKQKNLLARMTASGILSRRHGSQFMIDVMKSEGKKATAHYWQRVALLADIVMVAPMLGLLGTVSGMFYAFYDINRSIESLSALFDGLGIAIGATVAGLFVAISSMVFHTMLRHRLSKTLQVVEHEAIALSNLIEPTKQPEDLE
jgi:biopolymer transport protein ExbB